MRPERSVHDNVVYAYSVDCNGERLTLHTAFGEREPREFTDVIFRGVVAHHFAHVLAGNILFDVTEVEVANVLRDNADLFADSWRYGWPSIEYEGDLEFLAKALKAASVRAYSISSSYGLSGWVLARVCERLARSEAARVA